MRNFFTLSVFLVIFKIGLAQTATTIYTPNWSVVSDTYLFAELSSSQIAFNNNWVAINYPNATRLTDASQTYNCHAYAFRVSEGGSNVWIGWYTTSAEDIYWNDGSYLEVCTQPTVGKVSYASDNHSAITTNQTDIFKSKWGNLPLMQHAKNYSPYNSSALKYYVKTPIITGLDSLPVCFSTNYQVNLPPGTTVLWSATGGISISGSNTNSSVNVVKNTSGPNSLTATITSSCGAVSISKQIANSYASISGPDQICNNGSAYYGIVNAPSGTTWTVDGDIAISGNSTCNSKWL